MTDYPIPISFPSGNRFKHIILLAAVAAADDDDIRKHSFPSRTYIFPCMSYGEVFFKAHLLDLHHGQGQAMKHTLSRASRHCGTIASTMDERCIADGNKRLWFYILLHHVVLPECRWSIGSPYYCTCEILQHNFLGQQVDLAGIMTYSSAWGDIHPCWRRLRERENLRSYK